MFGENAKRDTRFRLRRAYSSERGAYAPQSGLKYEGRRKKEELGKRQNLWRRFAYSLHIRVRAFSVFGDQAFDPRRHNGERYGAELEHGIVESTNVEFRSERLLRSRGE